MKTTDPIAPEKPSDVAKEVCALYEVTLAQIKSKARTQNVSKARKAVACALRERTFLSIPEIGTFLNRDHTTICYLIGSRQRWR